MPRRFPSTSHYAQTLVPPVTGAPLTMAVWERPHSLGNTAILMSLGDKDSTATNNKFRLIRTSTGTGQFVATTTSSTPLNNTLVTVAVNEWSHYLGSSNATYSPNRMSINGITNTLSSGNRIPVGVDSLTVGCYQAGAIFAGSCTADLFWPAVWSEQLMPEEELLLAMGVCPRFVRGEHLVFFVEEDDQRHIWLDAISANHLTFSSGANTAQYVCGIPPQVEEMNSWLTQIIGPLFGISGSVVIEALASLDVAAATVQLATAALAAQAILTKDTTVVAVSNATLRPEHTSTVDTSTVAAATAAKTAGASLDGEASSAGDSTVAIAGVSDLAASVTSDGSVVGSLLAGSTITAEALVTPLANALLQAVGALAADATLEGSGIFELTVTCSIDGVADAVATATRLYHISETFTAATVVVGDVIALLQGGGTFTVEVEVIAEGGKSTEGSCTITCEVTSTGDGETSFLGSATLTVDGSVAGTTTLAGNAAATLTCEAVIVADNDAALQAAADLSATGTITALVFTLVEGHATLTSATTCDAAASRTLGVSATLTSDANLVTLCQAALGAAQQLDAIASLVGDGTLQVGIEADLTVTAATTIAATTIANLLTTVSVTCEAVITASGEIVGVVVTTSDGRTLLVMAENRTVDINADFRTLFVKPD